jgi:hypothetical protein
MNPDALDDFVRGSLLSEEVAPQRVDRLVATVMARLDLVEQRQAAPDWSQRCRAWAAGWRTMLVPAGRFAIPMAVAVLLGVMVGNQFQAQDTSIHVGDLLSTTSIQLASY